MNQQIIDEVNKELSEYSASKERVLQISDDAGEIVKEVVYSLDEILEAEENTFDYNYYYDNNDILEKPIQNSTEDSFFSDLTPEEFERIEKEYLKIIGEFEKNEEIIEREKTHFKIIGEFEEIHRRNLDSEETIPNIPEIIINTETQSENPEDIKKDLFKKLRLLKTGDEIRNFIIKNLDCFEGFFDQNNIFLKTLNNKFENLSLTTLQSFTYFFKRKGKDFEELVIKLEILLRERLMNVLKGSSLDQEDSGIIITNGFSEIITNRDSKFIIIENKKTGEYYIVAKGYDITNDKIAFELHRDIFQYFLDKIGFSLRNKFDAYDYEVRGGGYIQVNKDKTMYLHKESMDYGQADFEFTKQIILEKFGINASYRKK